jgi:SAM-dependent methyltransferase
MANYWDIHYFRDEYGEEAYPQKLCDYLIRRYIAPQEKKENLSLLDIGSGKGNYLVGFGRRGIQTYGLDKRRECLDVLNSFDIRECDLERDPFPFPTSFLISFFPNR